MDEREVGAVACGELPAVRAWDVEPAQADSNAPAFRYIPRRAPAAYERPPSNAWMALRGRPVSSLVRRRQDRA